MNTRSSHDLVRYVAAASAAGAAIVYLLIGFEVVYIGESTTGEAPDLLGFGLSAGIAFGLMAILLLLVDRRLVWIPAGLVSAAVFVAYFAMGGIREPSYEVWGLLIKVLQAVVVVATTYLAFRAQTAERPAAGMRAIQHPR
jgi:hypothetical protein